MISIALPNIREFKASLDDVAVNQIPYATARGVRELLLLSQLAIRSHTGQIFKGKNPGWVSASVKIVKWPSKYEGDLWGQIGIHPPGGDEKSDIIGKFETDTVVLPHIGAHKAIPAGINEGKTLREGQRFRDYHFVQHGGMWQDAARHAYMIRLAGDKLGVFQRVEHRTRYKRHGKAYAANKGGSVLLFILVPLVHITPDLQFEATTRRIVETQAERVLSVELDHAIATAR